jgi:hypothetical protein
MLQGRHNGGRDMKRPDISYRLNVGTHFPGVSLTLLGGRSARFPAEVESRYRILFLYCGYH